MELVSLEVDSTRSLFLPMEETIIMPIGDLQLGAPGCDLDRLRRHILWGMKHKAWFLGMGDYLDVFSPSGRAKYAAADYYDSVEDAMDEIIGQQQRQLEAILAPTKGRWIGLLEGHHFHKYQSGMTTDQRLAEFLKTRFLGTSTLTILLLGHGKRGGKPVECRIWAHHGAGSGMTMAAPMNRLERIANHFEADIFLMGHYHRKIATKTPHMRFEVNHRSKKVRVRAANRILATTGGFLHGWEAGSQHEGRPMGSYIEKRVLPPTAEGGIVLYVRPRRAHEGRSYLDLDVSL